MCCCVMYERSHQLSSCHYSDEVHRYFKSLTWYTICVTRIFLCIQYCWFSFHSRCTVPSLHFSWLLTESITSNTQSIRHWGCWVEDTADWIAQSHMRKRHFKTCYLTDRVRKRKSNEEEQWGRLKGLLTIFYSRGLESHHIERRGRREDKMKERLATGPAKYSTHTSQIALCCSSHFQVRIQWAKKTSPGVEKYINSKYVSKDRFFLQLWWG